MAGWGQYWKNQLSNTNPNKKWRTVSQIIFYPHPLHNHNQ